MGGSAILSAAARLIGVNDKPMNGPLFGGPERFSGPGWYAFQADDAPATVVQFAEIEDEAFIRLSDGGGSATRAYLSHKTFDRLCVGRVFSVAEAERMAKAGGRVS